MAPNRCCRFLPSPQGMRKKTICVFFCAGAWRPVPHEREKTIGARLQKKTLGARVVPPVGRRKRRTTLMSKKLDCKKTQCFLRPQMVFGGNRLGLATTSVCAAAVPFFCFFYYHASHFTTVVLFTIFCILLLVSILRVLALKLSRLKADVVRVRADINNPCSA